jgi:hypothetical protein
MKVLGLPAVLLALLAALSVIPLDEVHGGGYAPGETVRGHGGYTEYEVGDLPIILSVPHGGPLKPAEIPDRSQAVVDNDPYVDELGAELAAEIERLTGRPAHLVRNQLHRSKLDANRTRLEGARRDPTATQAWEDYHGFLLAAEQAIVEGCGRGLLIDLHTNGGEGYRIEFGYGLTVSDLEVDDERLNREPYLRRSTLRALARLGPVAHADLIRGPLSLGGLMTSVGYAAEPSPQRRVPDGEPYFNGGYTIYRHGSLYGGWIDAVQVEVSYDLLRPAARLNLIRSLAAAALTFVDTAYGFNLTQPGAAACPAFVDVPFTHPASSAIETLQAAGALTACGAGPRRFCPWDPVTRADAAVMSIRRAEGKAMPAGPGSFSDLPSGRWDAAYAGEAWRRGWIDACAGEPLRYCPEAPLSRQQAAHLAVSMSPWLVEAGGRGTVADVPPGTAADEAFATLHAGLLLPCRVSPEIYFCPQQPVTRAELAQLLAAIRTERSANPP